MSIFNSVPFTIDATSQSEISLPQYIYNSPHTFIGVEFDAPVTAGTYTIEAMVLGSIDWQAIDSGTDVDPTLNFVSIGYAGNVPKLRYTPTGITGPTNVILTVSSNSS